MTETIAFIPARKGSKRVVNKNTRSFHGKPLALWTLEFARDARIFDRIVLSTDDKQLMDIVDPGIIVCKRPAELSNDTATVLQTIIHTAAELKIADDTIIVVLLATGPLRVKSDLTEGMRLFEQHNRTRSVVSVSPHLIPPKLLWQMNDDNSLVPLATSRSPDHTRKQNHPCTYHSNDILVIDTLQNFRRPGRDLFGPDPIGLLVPSERDMPIDVPVQFRIAEFLFPPTDERL